MPEKIQNPKKYGFAEILKKAVMGCGEGCCDGCSGSCSEIKIVQKETTGKEEKD